MLSTYEIVASAFSLLVCQAQNTPCSLRKSLHSCHSILLIVRVILPKSQRTHRRKMIRICLQDCYNIYRNLTSAIPIQKDGFMQSICVFCGSSDTVHDDYKAAAWTMGRILAERGLRLIYGGGKTGLMGAVAD